MNAYAAHFINVLGQFHSFVFNQKFAWVRPAVGLGAESEKHVYRKD